MPLVCRAFNQACRDPIMWAELDLTPPSYSSRSWNPTDLQKALLAFLRWLQVHGSRMHKLVILSNSDNQPTVRT